MKKVTNQNFYNYIDDILNFLEKYIDVTEIRKKYSETRYILTDKEQNMIDVYKNKFISTKVGLNEGVTTVPIYELNGSYKILNPICYVRNSENNQELILNVMFHELMHVASIKQTLENKETLVYDTGINKRIFRINGKYEEKYDNLNEAMTELVAKVIYENIYGKPYYIVVKKDENRFSSFYEKSYFLLAFLLLNYFEDHLSELFEIYFNNNIELLEKILNENTNMNLEKLDKIVNKLQKNFISPIINSKYRKTIDILNKENPIKNQEVLKEYML